MSAKADDDAEECTCPVSIALPHAVGGCELAALLVCGGKRLRDALNALEGPLWPGGPMPDGRVKR